MELLKRDNHNDLGIFIDMFVFHNNSIDAIVIEWEILAAAKGFNFQNSLNLFGMLLYGNSITGMFPGNLLTKITIYWNRIAF